MDTVGHHGSVERRRGARRLSDLTTAVLEACPMPVTVKDADGLFVFVNSAAAEMFGRRPLELVGQPESSFIPHELAQQHDEEDASVLDGRTCWRGEETLEGLDGRDRTYLVRKVATQDAQGEPLVICTMTDVRALKRAEAGARTAEERDARSTAILRSVLDSSEAAIFSVDREYRYTSFNAAQAVMMRELYGCETQLGSRLTACLPTEVWARAKPLLDRALAGESFVDELAQGEEERSFEISYRPVKEHGVLVTGAAVFVRETTAHRRAEAALAASEERLRQSQKMDAIGRLAGGVAHDLNNILTVVLSAVSFMQAVGANEGPFGKDIEEIGVAAERAKALTSQLLSFSRRQPVHPVVFDVNEKLTELSQLLRRIIGEDVKLAVTLEKAPATVLADPNAFDQAMMNLIVNARDALPGGGTITVRTASAVMREEKPRETDDAAERTHVLISVQDTGHGMTAEVREHLFEPFFTTKERGKGTGLGLAIAYGAVRQAHGFIEVESEEGEGTTFNIYLPIAAAPDEKAATQRSDTARAKPGERVLVVEDDPAVQAATVRALEQAGWVVAAASSLKEAVAVAKVFPPTVVVIDVVLPDADGVQTAQAIRQLKPGVPVLYMSGFPDEVLAKHGLSAETGVLRKPFSPEDVVARVRRSIDAGAEVSA